jgi:hypothetical protein
MMDSDSRPSVSTSTLNLFGPDSLFASSSSRRALLPILPSDHDNSAICATRLQHEFNNGPCALRTMHGAR